MRKAEIRAVFQISLNLKRSSIQEIISILKQLFSKGAIVDSQDNHNFTPLMYAIETNHIEIVDFLLNNHANVNVKLFNGSVALHMAARLGHFDILKVMLDFGPNLDCQDNGGLTPLMFAIINGHLETAKLLIR